MQIIGKIRGVAVAVVEYTGNTITSAKDIYEPDEFHRLVKTPHVTEGQWELPAYSPENAQYAMMLLGYDVTGDIIEPPCEEGAIY